jgi:hypothetical protein
MQNQKAIYPKILISGNLSRTAIVQICNHLQKQGLKITEISPSILRKNEDGERITENLTRLSLFLVEGSSSWEGLLVGFPGNREELSTKSVGTPYLRKILYPILDLHHRIQNQTGKRLPCIYIVGERFSDVFLRKFELLKEVIPHIIVLTNDVYQCSLNKSVPIKTEKVDTESWTQMKLCQVMNSPGGLEISTETGNHRIKFISYEIPCSEGTENPERLDILGYDASDHSLIAFEIKGPNAGRVELENLFLQGIEHRNWLEKNKMAVKLLFDGGPRGKRINTKKRVRLLLGFYGNKVPPLFYELREESRRRDRFIEINFIQISPTLDTIRVMEF